jgi:hypothetical protein
MGVKSVTEILDENGDLPDSVLLGRIVLFTITDRRVKRSDLETEFINRGLNTALLPPEVKPIDAWKKATSEAKDKYNLPGDKTAVVLCRDVNANAEYVRRQITREVKDARSKTLSYHKAIDCMFYRPRVQGGKAQVGSERVSIRVDTGDLDPAEVADVRRIAQQIEDRYADYYGHLDGNRVRATIREYLKHLNAIELKGGVYFIHVSQSDELSRLQGLVEWLGGGCMMHTIPLVDIERERQMVSIAFEREASQALQEIVNEVASLKATRKSISADAYSKIKQRYDDVLSKANEHMVTLQISQDMTGVAAELALDAITDLAEEMLSGT